MTVTEDWDTAEIKINSIKAKLPVCKAWISSLLEDEFNIILSSKRAKINYPSLFAAAGMSVNEQEGKMLLHHTLKSIFSKVSLFHLGLIVSLGLATTSPSFLLAATLKQSEQKQSQPKVAILPDGTYLYGQSSTPEQIGQEYLVFQVRQGKVLGSIYFPRSEFNCFYGTLDSQQMNLSIVDPYNNSIYPYSIALQELSPIAGTGERVQRSIGLEGYEQIELISENDRRILNVCQEQHRYSE